MSDFEADVIDRLGRIETKLDNDYKALHGNGHPGLIDRVSNIEATLVNSAEHTSRIVELEKSVMNISTALAANAGKHSGIVEFIATVLALMSIVGTGVTLFITLSK